MNDIREHLQLMAAVESKQSKQSKKFNADTRQLKEMEYALGRQLYFSRGNSDGLVRMESIRTQYDLLKMHEYD